MKNTFQQVFRSGKFLVGFIIFMAILLTVIIYPLIITDPPLAIIAQGTFFPPGIYVSTFDAINSPTTYILHLDSAAAKRVANKMTQEDRLALKEWLDSR
jgi:peptide/nickel transport system permease protein